MKRFLSIILLVAALLPVADAFAVRYGVKKKIILGGTGAIPQYLAHSSTSNTIYCGNAGLGTVSYIDGGNDTLLGAVPGAGPGAMMYDSIS